MGFKSKRGKNGNEQMNTETQIERKLPFAAEKDSLLFHQEVIRLLIKEADNRRKKYVPTENFQVYYHGVGWNFQRQEKDGFKPHSGEFKKVSTGHTIKLDRIVANDITVISDFIREAAGQMEQGLVQRLVEEMASVTSETGNTISIAKEGSLAEAFLEAIKSTQAGVRPDGRVSRPTLFLNDPSVI